MSATRLHQVANSSLYTQPKIHRQQANNRKMFTRKQTARSSGSEACVEDATECTRHTASCHMPQHNAACEGHTHNTQQITTLHGNIQGASSSSGGAGDMTKKVANTLQVAVFIPQNASWKTCATPPRAPSVDLPSNSSDSAAVVKQAVTYNARHVHQHGQTTSTVKEATE